MAWIENKTRLANKKYGEGTLISYANDKIIVNFDVYGEKIFTGQDIIDKKIWEVTHSNNVQNPTEFNKSNNIIGSCNVLEACISSMVLSMQVTKDYLQIFELSTNENILTIKHSQEVPPYEKIYKFIVLEPINEKIYIIDDIKYSTMLLADEY